MSRNIKYYDINTKTIKTAHHDSKDEAQYSDPPSERSPASTHLIEVFTETPHEQIGSQLKIPTKVVEIEAPNKKKKKKIDTEAIIDEILKNSPQPYTHAAAAKIKADLTKIADLLNTDEETDKAYNVNRMQYTQPDIDHLKQELDNVDVSTNVIYNTVHEMIPLKSSHPPLGLIVNDLCDLQNTVEFTDTEVGTAAHNRMRNWKRRL